MGDPGHDLRKPRAMGVARGSLVPAAMWQRRVVAGLTVVWALACTAGIFLKMIEPQTGPPGPPGMSGIGSLIGTGVLVVLWTAVGAALVQARIGGVLLAALGVVVLSLEAPPLFRWGVGLGAVVMGILTVTVGLIASRTRSGASTA
jgi:hypothetical protein